MIAQHVADVLAKKAFDAFAEFLHTIDVLLLHPPCAVGRIGRSRLKRFDFFLNAKVPRDVCDQVFQNWKRFHRLDCHRFVQRKLAESRHTHQFWHPIDFRRAGAALASLAIPAAGKVLACVALNMMNRVEYNHSLGNLGRVITKFAACSSRSQRSDSEMFSLFIRFRSFHFLDDLLQMIRHFRQGFQRMIEPSAAFRNHRIYFRELVVLVGIIIPELCAAAFLSFERRARDRFRNGE